MKKLIIILILSLTTLAFAGKPLTISILNTTDKTVIVYIDSIDHNVEIGGRIYRFPAPVCGGEIAPCGVFILQPRHHNNPPYRYILTVCRLTDNSITSRVSTIFIIEPHKKEHIIIIGTQDD
jgi:hypothetical protein